MKYCLQYVNWGLPWWLSGKEPACQCRRCRFEPWVGKIPWRRKWHPTPVFLPGTGSLAGYIVHGVTERLRRELMTIQQSVVLYDSKCEECFPFSCDFLEFLILVHHSYMHFSWTVSFNSYNSCIFGSALLSQIFLVYMDW